MTMIQQAACGQRGVASMTITTFLGRLIQTQSHLRPCSASASWRAHSMMTSPSPRKRNCQSLAVTTNSLPPSIFSGGIGPMQMNYISGNSMRSVEFLNPMNFRCYCNDGGGRRRRWDQRQYQSGQFTTPDRMLSASATLQDYVKLISCSTAMASPQPLVLWHQNYRYHLHLHHHYQQLRQQHYHQRTFSSSQTVTIADRHLNELRVDDGLGRHTDGDDTILSIQDHLDKLHTIPLENIRNFCIIAHVVSVYVDFQLYSLMLRYVR